MECWTQLLIIKVENALKSAARFTDEPQTLKHAENLNGNGVKQAQTDSFEN